MHWLIAYIDPGAGSLLVQAIVGGVLAGMYAVKLYWQKVKAGGRKFADFFKRSGR